MLKESDIEFGRWNPLIKHAICYGGFVGGVVRRVFDCNHGMHNVRWYLPSSIRLLRMIDMLLSVVRWGMRVGIGQGFQLCIKRELELRVVWQILFLTCSESQDITGRVTLLLWQIWVARNDVIWNDVHRTSTSIGMTTLGAWQQWQDVHKQPSPLAVQHGHNRVQGNNSIWEKPRETWLKCNVDAAFHDRNHITSFACCVRDSRW